MIEKPNLFHRLKLKISGFYRQIKPIMLSHHPACDNFKDHTFHLFKWDFCIGCFITYPSALIMILIGYVSGLFSFLSLGTLLKVGIILLCSYLLSILKITKYKKIKIISKVIIGGGIAFITAFIFALPVLLLGRIVLFLLFLQTGIMFVNGKRALEIRKICKNCEFHSEGDNCPGLYEIFGKFNANKNPREK